MRRVAALAVFPAAVFPRVHERPQVCHHRIQHAAVEPARGLALPSLELEHRVRHASLHGCVAARCHRHDGGHLDAANVRRHNRGAQQREPVHPAAHGTAEDKVAASPPLAPTPALAAPLPVIAGGGRVNTAAPTRVRPGVTACTVIDPSTSLIAAVAAVTAAGGRRRFVVARVRWERRGAHRGGNGRPPRRWVSRGCPAGGTVGRCRAVFAGGGTRRHQWKATTTIAGRGGGVCTSWLPPRALGILPQLPGSQAPQPAPVARERGHAGLHRLHG